MISASEALAVTWRSCVQQDWTGWDPYDGLMVRRWPVTALLRSRWGRLALIQGMKRSPVNLRPLLGIPRLRNPKAMALGLSAATLLGGLPAWRDRALPEARRLVDDLLALARPTPSGQGWGYPFDWQARAFWIPRGTPTVVCTGFVVRALDSARSAAIVGDRVAPAVEAAARFVDKDLNRTESEGGFCWSYSPLDRSCVVNATLLGAETVARAARLLGDAGMFRGTLPTVSWSLARQNAEGGWAYGTAGHHGWEDAFHTGFNLLSLSALRNIAVALDVDPGQVCPEERLVRGARYYAEKFFDPDGRPWYYRHSPWPIDAHAAAVGIITLVQFAEFVPELLDRARRVVHWTLGNLWRGDGFVFQRHRHYTIGVPYLRWSNAWMLLALATWEASAARDQGGVRISHGGG
ncbi:MAG: hypothetical protein KA760_03715 [Steroidobacteraceae bacterium]|nr:hypothetical protein [Steroidobacteraceae bacterium]